MTREEKQKAIDALKISTPIMAMTQEEFNDYIQILNKIMDWLEQETVSKESYDHEYFLRKEFEIKIARLEHDKNVVLDKIRAEIQNGIHHFLDGEPIIEIKEVLQILDKYKPEREALADIYKPTLKADLCIMDEFAFMPQAESEDQE